MTKMPSPYGELSVALTDAELRETSYEIFVAACRTTGGKPLTYISQSDKSPASSEKSLTSSLSLSSTSSSRSLTSSAASKMKKALGIKKKRKEEISKKPMSVGELVRVQMGVSEQTDSRVRRGLLRIAAGQLGKRIESMVLPLELLQQFKTSDFPNNQEYETWQTRNLKVLEAGLLAHPLVPLQKSDSAAQRLRQILRGASERPLETGKNSESMQVLRNAVMNLACRSPPDSYGPEMSHWADGFPLNLHLYQMIIETCFDNEEGSIIDEIDEVLELIKKTWAVLGIDQKLHNLVFLWVMFNRYVNFGQVDTDLLFTADNQLTEVIKDAKTTKDTTYSKVLSSTLSSIMGWAEKRLLAYHDTFAASNIDTMECIVSLGVTSAKLLVEDISNEYRRRRKDEVDVARTRIDTYIRSSLRTAFAQMMEKADSSRRSSKNTPLLAILAKDIGELANKEKNLFSPILKKWHPLAAGVAVATLHSCYGNELKQFISGVTELTVDYVNVLKAAEKLEKDLVHIAVEDSVDSDDGGKGLIREMPPFEAESSIADLARKWIKTRVDKLKEWIERNVQQEAWNPRANKDNIAPSGIDILRIIDETIDAFFHLPIPMHKDLLPDLISGLDKSLQNYISKVKAGCGTRNTFIPTLPSLTRCETSSGLFKKKEKHPSLQKRISQVGTMNGGDSHGLAQLCVRMNSFYHIRTELETLDKKIKTCLKNVESAQVDILNGFDTKFELSISASHEGIVQLCESTAYRVIFHDLSHVLWESLYVGETASSRIYPLLKELDPTLELISTTVHSKVRNRLITALMKASFDGFLLVVLAGGPSRNFTRQDSQILEEDLKALVDLYLADGDGLPMELVEKASAQARNVLPLFKADTETLISQFKRLCLEGSNGSSTKSKLPMPPTSGHWSPNEANTILRVLCYRKDDAASKFLKKNYALPKKL